MNKKLCNSQSGCKRLYSMCSPMNFLQVRSYQSYWIRLKVSTGSTYKRDFLYTNSQGQKIPKETPISSNKVGEFIYCVIWKKFHTLLKGIGDLPIVWLKKKNKETFEVLSSLCTLHLHVKYQSNPSTQVVLHVALYIYKYFAL